MNWWWVLLLIVVGVVADIAIARIAWRRWRRRWRRPAKRRWAEVGASAPRVNQTEYTLAGLLVAFLSLGLALLLGWWP